MLEKKISSLQHPLVKHWEKLRREKNYREEKGALLIAGEKMIREFPFPLRTLISLQAAPLMAEQRYFVTEAILKKITGLETPDGFAAEVELPLPQDVGHCRRLLILDQLQDPGNMGTLLRTALAFGWEGVVATPGTVDFFNDKALRAAKGATFRLAYSWKTPEEIALLSREKKWDVWVADLTGKDLETIPFHLPFALVLSSEGEGVNAWARKLGKAISIPLKRGVESLNVAAAGAILLYTMGQAK